MVLRRKFTSRTGTMGDQQVVQQVETVLIKSPVHGPTKLVNGHFGGCIQTRFRELTVVFESTVAESVPAPCWPGKRAA